MNLTTKYATVVIGAGALLLAFAIFLVSAGLTIVGNPLIAVGATLLGSGIVGLFVAKATATMTGEISQDIERRREHRGSMHQFIKDLATPRKFRPTPTDSMSFVYSQLEVQSGILPNLEDATKVTTTNFLWNDMKNHWPEVKSKAESVQVEVQNHNLLVKNLADDWNSKLRARVESSTFLHLQSNPDQKRSENDERFFHDSCIFVNARLGAFSEYCLGLSDVKPSPAVNSGEVAALPLPSSIDFLGVQVDFFSGLKGDSVPEELKDVVKIGKGGLKPWYYEKLAKFLQDSISSLADEFRADRSVPALIKEKQILNDELTGLERDLQKILLSPYLPGDCEFIKAN